jgi:hypothetical protein
MPIPSFRDWLQEEIPDATRLAMQIALSGAAG